MMDGGPKVVMDKDGRRWTRKTTEFPKREQKFPKREQEFPKRGVQCNMKKVAKIP